MKMAVSKALRRICVVVLLCLVVALFATACRQNTPDDSKTNDSLNSKTDNSSIISGDQENTTEATENRYESMDQLSLAMTFLDYYKKFDRTVFLKLEILKIYDEMYIDEWDIGQQNPAGSIMVECTIIEDLYEGGFELGQKIVVPIFLQETFSENDSYVSRNLDVSEVKAWLSGMDYIYVKAETYYANAQPYAKATFVAENNHTTELQTELWPCRLSLYELLPSVDGKVSLRKLDEFCYERNIKKEPHANITRMYSFCYDGIPCAEFEDNVRELSKYFDNKRNK